MEESRTDEERVIKELLDTSKNLESKTDLTPEQIVEICKLKHIAKKYKLGELSEFIKDFMLLSVSKNRLGRKEFIEALKAERENRENAGLFSGMKERLR